MGQNFGSTSSTLFGNDSSARGLFKLVENKAPILRPSMTLDENQKKLVTICQFVKCLEKEQKIIEKNAQLVDIPIIEAGNELFDDHSAKNKVLWEYGRWDDYAPYKFAGNKPNQKKSTLLVKLDIIEDHSHPEYVESQVEQASFSFMNKIKIEEIEREAMAQHKEAVIMKNKYIKYLATVAPHNPNATEIRSIMLAFERCHDEKHKLRNIENQRINVSEFEEKHQSTIDVQGIVAVESLGEKLKEKMPALYDWLQTPSQTVEELNLKRVFIDHVYSNPNVINEYQSKAAFSIYAEILLNPTLGATGAAKAILKAGLLSIPAGNLSQLLSSETISSLNSLEKLNNEISSAERERLQSLYIADQKESKEFCDTSSYVSSDFTNDILAVPFVQEIPGVTKRNEKALLDEIKNSSDLELKNSPKTLEQPDFIYREGDSLATTIKKKHRCKTSRNRNFKQT